MFTFRRFLSCAVLLSFAAFAGCSLLSGGSSSREVRSGFTVRVDGPGLPGAAGVVADVEAFAQGRGFVRQSTGSTPRVDPVTHEPLPATPDRYLRESIVLEVSRQPAEHRVTAYLHGADVNGNRKFIDQFYRGFVQGNAGRYGGADRISETAYADESTGSSVAPPHQPMVTGSM